MNRVVIEFSKVNSSGISDLSKTVIAVAAGVAIFVVGQWILEFILKPLRDYKNVKNKVANNLKLYADILGDPKSDFTNTSMIMDGVTQNVSREEMNKIVKEAFNHELHEKYQAVSKEIRVVACDLEVGFYNNFAPIRFFLDKNEDINQVSACLIRISNCILNSSRADQITKDIESIKKLLRIN